MTQTEFDTPYSLDTATIQQFREDGFVHLENVLSEQTLAEYVPEINRLVDAQHQYKDVPISENVNDRRSGPAQ